MKAPISVIITSAMATPMKRYEWIPTPGFPNASLYLHKSTIYIPPLKNVEPKIWYEYEIDIVELYDFLSYFKSSMV